MDILLIFIEPTILLAFNSNYVTYHIVRTFTFLIFFMGTITIYLYLFSSGTLKGVGNLPMSVQHLIYSPIYIFEVLWLLQKGYTQTLIKVSVRKRITSHSKGLKKLAAARASLF